jgi:signal transduction histidine kinase
VPREIQIEKVREQAAAPWKAEERLRESEGRYRALREQVRVLHQLRAEVWRMRQVKDIAQVLSPIGVILNAREVSFLAYAINLVDDPGGEFPIRVYIHDPEGRQLQVDLKRDQAETRPILEAWRSGRALYRPDLLRENHYGEHLKPQSHYPQVRAAIDVPFSRGTLALASAEPEAFSPDQVAFFAEIAQVVEEGFRRVEDLQALALQGQQLAQLQKLEAIGQLATGVAHEINNPLTAVVGYSEMMLRKETDPQRRQQLETIHQEGLRAAEIIGQLMNFSRRQRADKQRLELNPLVEELVALVRQQFALDQVHLSAELAESLPLVEVQPGQLQQVVLSLLHNSREAILRARQGERVRVRTCWQGEWVRLEVEDDGPGIPPELRERIFEPFFTTKEPGKGPGLGLSICHAIAREHGGRLWAAPREKGACLTLELPAAGELRVDKGAGKP